MPTKREDRNAYNKAYYEKNREKIRAYQNEYFRTHPKNNGPDHRKRRYGLTQSEVDAMIVDQGRRCAICEVEFGEIGRAHV
jgi:hypothetical protein